MANRGGAVTGALVSAHATDPRGVETEQALYDNGTRGDAKANDGVYTTTFTAGKKGTYRFLITSTGKSALHELVPREELRFIHASPPTAPIATIILLAVLSVASLAYLVWQKMGRTHRGHA